MKVSFNKFIEVAEMLWTLPQTLMGLGLIQVLKGEKQEPYERAEVYSVQAKFFSGVSLGKYIILNERYFNNKEGLNKTVKHEYGHYKQNLYLGWLYLLVVGVQSLGLNLVARVSTKTAVKYYDFWTEKWADKLGGVNRE